MSTSPKVTIVIPGYNPVVYLPETMESVLNQTVTDLELIVVNDGSTDETLEVAKGYETDPRVTVIDQKNQGVSVARNRGFKASKGAYIAFLDADDVWLPNNLEAKLKKFDEDPDIGLVHTDVAIIDGNSRRTGEVKSGKEGYILDDLLLWNGDCIPAPSSILVKREAVEKVGGFDPQLSYGADQDFFFRVAAEYKIGRVPEPLGLYRVHGSNMSLNIEMLEHDSLLNYRLARERGLFANEKLRRKAYAKMYRILAGSWWKNAKNRRRGLYFAIKATLSWPPIVWKNPTP